MTLARAAVRDLGPRGWAKDCGIVFKSPRETFAHILAAERLWHARLTGNTAACAVLGSAWRDGPQDWESAVGLRGAPDADVLRALDEQCAEWQRLLRDWTSSDGSDGDAQVLRVFEYTSTDGEPRAAVRAAALAQVFNHGENERPKSSADGHTQERTIEGRLPLPSRWLGWRSPRWTYRRKEETRSQSTVAGRAVRSDTQWMG